MPKIQRQMNHKRCRLVWVMVHRVKSMGKRNDLYLLNGLIEFDEGHFTIEPALRQKDSVKRWKGFRLRKDIAVMA